MTKTATKLQIVPEPFKIEMGVPLPDNQRKTGAGDAVRAFAAAPIGSSMFWPGEAAGARASLYALALRVGGRGWFAIRKTDGGHRIWKTAEPAARA